MCGSAPGATAAVILRPHFYQTYFFGILCAIAGAGLFVVALRLRMRQLRVNETKLVLLVDERTRALGITRERSKKAKSASGSSPRIFMKSSGWWIRATDGFSM